MFLKSSSQRIYFLGHAETEQGVAQAIIRSFIDFKRDPWPRVSNNAKDLVMKMLDPDPKRRLTAQEVIGIALFSLMIIIIFGISVVINLSRCFWG